MPVLSFDIDRLRRDIDVSDEIMRLIPEENPWLVMTMQSRELPTLTAEYNWFDGEPWAYWTTVNGAHNDTVTSIVLTTGGGVCFAAKDVAKVPSTGEVMYVTAVSTDTLTVVRGYGETAAASIADGAAIVCLGNAMEERSSAPAEKVGQPTKDYNYCEITRTPFGDSATVEAERQVTTEQERSRLTKDKLLDHRLARERQYLFGERKEDAANKRRMTRGLEKAITTNVYDAGGALTQTNFDTQVCEKVFKYGTRQKVLIASPRMVSIINGWANARLQMSQGAKEYGLELSEYVSPHGRLLIAPSKALEQYYAYHSFIVDMKYIAIRSLRKTKLRRNIQAADVDGFLDEYVDEAGLQVRLQKTHMTIKNATS